MTKPLVAFLVLLVMANARVAGASEAKAEGSDELIGMGQVLAAVGVTVGGVALAGATEIDSPAALAFLLATPFGVGAAVCGVGKWSSHNDGSCAAAIGGAYLGALSVIPLAVLGYQLDVRSGGSDEFDGLGGLLLGAAAGWLVMQPLLSTVAWHTTKRPRAQPVAIVPRPSRLLVPPGPTRGRQRAPGQLTMTLFSAGF
jgi:hypothetical protein